ncbi:hypothetical protein [Corynebacterium pyruviciproducens]
MSSTLIYTLRVLRTSDGSENELVRRRHVRVSAGAVRAVTETRPPYELLPTR